MQKTLLMPCLGINFTMVDFAFIDSGTGGIPYLLHLKSLIPNAKCVYVGDTKNFPYGTKSSNEIVECVTCLVQKIIDKFDPKVFVVACNTMSVNALNSLRNSFPNKSFVGTVPAIKVAAEVTKKRIFGLLATEATVHSDYNFELKEKYANDCKMILRGDSDLIDFIERKSFTASDAEIKQACVPAVNFFKDNDCDVIILGCTHFLNISKQIQDVCGTQIKVVDSKEGVVKHAIEVYEQALRLAKPVEGVAEKTGAQVFAKKKLGECAERTRGLWSEGETSPALFITGFNDNEDKKEYDALSKKYNIRFCGNID